MINKNTEPAKLVTYIRDGLIEKEHFGYIVRCDKIHVEERLGEDKNYPFYLRSCANPLQAALLIDYELDKKFNLTDEEIAICASTHAGEKLHTEVVRSVLNKFEIPVEKLKCVSNKDSNLTTIENHCSGKHAMMLGLCKVNNWDIDRYDNINHPVQKAIQEKINELCEVKTTYPITKDNCGVPIHSMPLANIAKGYLNLFCNPKYTRIKNAFLYHAFLIGGENRTDTKIISNSKNLIAKVGASGLCVVVNTEIEEAFVIKLCDEDLKARELVAIDLINNLHWAKIETSHIIKTNNDEIIGEVVTLLRN